MKKYLVFVLLLGVSFLMFAADISSTAAGGLWSATSTWVGGMLPLSTDNVIIDGPVILNQDGYCQNLTLNPAGVLYNHSSSNFSMLAYGDLSNGGSLGNNPNGGILYLMCYGDLANNGNMNPYILYFRGSEDQYLSGSATINATLVYDDQPTSSIVLASDIGFSGASLNFYGAAIVMGTGALDFDLTISGGYLYSAYVDGDDGDSVTLQHGAYLSGVSGDEIELWGDNIMLAECQFGILRNHGNLRNYSNSNYNLTVTQNLENHGTIEDHPNGGLLYIYISGHLYNHGTMNNYYINFQNNTLRNIWQGPSAQPFHFDFFYSASNYAGLQALSDLSFTNCQIDLQGATLRLTLEGVAYGINLQGGHLAGAVLDCEAASFLNSSGNAYLVNVSIDTMVWQGTVCVADYVSIGHLVNLGNLYNYHNSNYGMTVSSHLENHGNIADNPAGGLFYIYLGGDLYDHGSISNYYVSLTNSTVKNLFQSATASPISCDFIYTDPASGGHRLLSNLSFASCSIDYAACTLDMAYQQSGYAISLQAGYLVNANLNGGSTATLSMGGYAYLASVSATEISFQGTVLVASYVSVGTLHNLGILRNYHNSNYQMVVNTRLENHGTISNNPDGGLLLLDLYGDFWDYGMFDIYLLGLHKTSTMELYQDAAASPIRCYQMILDPGAGNIQLRSDLRCQNTTLEINNKQILMHNGRASYGLQISGAALNSATLVTNGYSGLEMYGGAYIANVICGDMVLQGEVLIANGCSFASIVNHGSLSNHSSSNYIASCSGDLVNYGAISNNPNGGLLYIYCAADISNYGSIPSSTLFMQSSEDQYLLNSGTITVGAITIISDIGDAYWFFNGNPLEPTYYAGQISIDASQFGVWYPQLGANRGRYVTVGTGSATLPAPTGVQLFFSGSELKLRWNEVAGAIYYNVWHASAPGGTFTLLEKVFDHDSGDGLVRADLSSQPMYRFYRVTAGN